MTTKDEELAQLQNFRESGILPEDAYKHAVKQVELKYSQAGVIGDNATVEGDIQHGDRIDIESKEKVAFAKDKGTAIIAENVTINPFGSDLESQRLRYLKELAAETNNLPWTNLEPVYADPKKGENIGLSDIYTALDITEMGILNTEDEVRNYLQRQGIKDRISAQEMINKAPHLVLLGDPGSGKSTFVNFLCHIMAQAGQIVKNDKWLEKLKEAGNWKHGVLFPIRVILRDFAAWIDSNKQCKEDNLLKCFLKDSLKTSEFENLWQKIYDSLLKHNPVPPCLILLDGLDEVPVSLRQTVVNAINEFTKKYTGLPDNYEKENPTRSPEYYDNYPGHRYIVTCRIYAYTGQKYRLHKYQQAALAPFNKEQISKFITVWYHELHLRRRITQKISEERAKQLLHATNRPDLEGLAERPLLLTVMALLHTFRGQLPDDRTELYQWTVDLLLQRWETRISGEQGLLETLNIPGLKMNDLEAGLYNVAFHVHASHSGKNTPDISEGMLREQLAPYLGKNWGKAGEFVKYIRERAGLLIRHKRAAYTFPHRTFQEFMAACHLVGMDDYPLESARLIHDDLDRWRVVYVLATGYAARTHRIGQAIASVNALCFGKTDDTGQPDVRVYHLAEIAIEALMEIGLVGINRINTGKAVKQQVKNWLLRALQADHELKPEERADAGNILNRLGDPRFNPDMWYLPGDENQGFVTVPAGEFLMGSDKKRDPEAYDNEFPQHTVELSDYKIARYPVTVSQYKVFANENCLKLDEEWKKYNTFDNHPVVEVGWNNAAVYCEWLTEKLKDKGIDCRLSLPTEAQWEKAARGTDARIYPWGDEKINPNIANYSGTGIHTTSPVGCFPEGKSTYGTLDSIGNAWEWCQDLYGKSPSASVTDPTGPNNSSYRVIRGGSWINLAQNCRSAYRYFRLPDYRHYHLGFRLVCLPGQP